jgi:hypothetical protein
MKNTNSNKIVELYLEFKQKHPEYFNYLMGLIKRNERSDKLKEIFDDKLK